MVLRLLMLRLAFSQTSVILQTKDGFLTMLRFVLTCTLAGAAAMAKTAGVGGKKAPAAAQPTATTADTLPPDAAVITVQGLCPERKTTGPAKPGCESKVTKAEFSRIVAAVNNGDHPLNRVTTRTFAENYAQVMTLASAARELGLDKDPSFEELMKYVRARTLADTYRRYLQQKYSKPSDEQYEAYYKQNIDKFTRLQVDHVVVPRVNPIMPRQQADEFSKRAEKTAADLRERVAKGEDPRELLNEAYKTLELGAEPRTDMGSVTKSSFLPKMWERISALRAGQVTELESQPAGFGFYKVRSRDVGPLEAVKDTLTRELSQRLANEEMEGVLGGVHPELNQAYFDSPPLGAPPVITPRGWLSKYA